MVTVATSYYHTEYGEKALQWLAEAHFDRGMFAEAAEDWKELGNLTEDKARYMAMETVASHLAGYSKRAGKLVRQLEKKHPEAAVMIGGKERKLVDFVHRSYITVH